MQGYGYWATAAVEHVNNIHKAKRREDKRIDESNNEHKNRERNFSVNDISVTNLMQNGIKPDEID